MIFFIFHLGILNLKGENICTFENKISTIFKKIEHNQKETQTLIKIRDTLLPKLITGKIRVKV